MRRWNDEAAELPRGGRVRSLTEGERAELRQEAREQARRPTGGQGPGFRGKCRRLLDQLALEESLRKEAL